MPIPITPPPADTATLEQVQRALDRWLITTPAADQPAVARALAHLRTALGCVFHGKLDSDSTPRWTVIPRQAGHLFHGKLDT